VQPKKEGATDDAIRKSPSRPSAQFCGDRAIASRLWSCAGLRDKCDRVAVAVTLPDCGEQRQSDLSPRGAYEAAHRRLRADPRTHGQCAQPQFVTPIAGRSGTRHL